MTVGGVILVAAIFIAPSPQKLQRAGQRLENWARNRYVPASGKRPEVQRGFFTDLGRFLQDANQGPIDQQE